MSSSMVFHACEETLTVEETAVCSETDVHAVWQVLFCLTVHDAEEDGEQCGDQNASQEPVLATANMGKSLEMFWKKMQVIGPEG